MCSLLSPLYSELSLNSQGHMPSTSSSASDLGKAQKHMMNAKTDVIKGIEIVLDSAKNNQYFIYFIPKK